jgi:hypothetical protein
MASFLNQLRIAPVVTDIFNGAVLFENEAVAEIVSQSFFGSVNGLTAKRKPVEDKSVAAPFFAAFLGGGSQENKYDALIGKSIIDKNLSIATVNHTQSYEGVSLIGSYKVDADGVSVKEKTPLVTDGVLQTLLSDRVPTPGVAQSNGHKRLVLIDGLTSKIVPGVVEMTAKRTTSNEKMKKQLIDLAKKKGSEYAYIVRKIGSPLQAGDDIESMATSMMAMMSGKNATEKPVCVYRVSVKDGTETLVRTASFSSVTIDSFKNVLAVSDKKQAWNLPIISKSGISGLMSQAGVGATASFIVPTGILLPDIELQKNKSVSLQKQPVTPNPLKK